MTIYRYCERCDEITPHESAINQKCLKCNTKSEIILLGHSEDYWKALSDDSKKEITEEQRSKFKEKTRCVKPDSSSSNLSDSKVTQTVKAEKTRCAKPDNSSGNLSDSKVTQTVKDEENKISAKKVVYIICAIFFAIALLMQVAGGHQPTAEDVTHGLASYDDLSNKEKDRLNDKVKEREAQRYFNGEGSEV